MRATPNPTQASTEAAAEHAPRPDLILAAVENYDWEPMRVFVESLEATGYDGEIRFFVSNIDDETLRTLQAHGIETTRPWRLRFDFAGRQWRPYSWKTNRLRWYSQPFYGRLVRAAALLSRDRRRAKARLAGALGNLTIARFFWYYAYLSQTAQRYRNVMLTDVRDVVFLGNPFDFDVGEGVNVFLEDEKQRIETHSPSRAWLLGAYGEATLAELSEQPIICAGVTIGAAPAMVEYLGVMVDHLARLARQFDGMDQGVHNYVIHSGLVPHVRPAGNEDGPVLTLALVDEEEATRLVNDRPTPARVVHQHDRHPRLRAELERRISGA